LIARRKAEYGTPALISAHRGCGIRELGNVPGGDHVSDADLALGLFYAVCVMPYVQACPGRTLRPGYWSSMFIGDREGAEAVWAPAVARANWVAGEGLRSLG